MEFATKLDENGIVEIFKATYSKKRTVIIHTVAIIFCVLAVTSGWIYNFGTDVVITLIYLIGAVMVELILYFNKKKALKITRARWNETTNGNVYIYHYRLGENALYAHNTTTDRENEMSYEHFEKYIETEHYALLLTKGNLCFAFDKEIAVKFDLKGFVKSKNALLKI